MKGERTLPISASLQRAGFYAVSEREWLSEKFRSSCNQAVSSRRMAKDVYFESILWRFFVKSKSEGSSVSFKTIN